MSNDRLKTVSFGPSFLGGIVLFCGFALLAWIAFRLVAAINADAQQKLYSPAHWIDKTKGTVQLPIDTAMDLVINDYHSKPVQPSQVKVDVPYPAGLQQAAAAANPSPEVKK